MYLIVDGLSGISTCFVSLTDGADSFATDISLVKSSLQHCLRRAVCKGHGHHDDGNCVPSDRVDTTKTYLGATDAMRLMW